MKKFWKKHCYDVGTIVGAFIFTSGIAIATGFHIGDWQWWCIVMSSMPYILLEYHRGRRDQRNETVNIIVNRLKEHYGDSVEISEKDENIR